MIYFIGDSNGVCDLVKIGYAKDVRKRVKELQTSSPIPLGIIWTEEGGLDKEKRLHRQFKRDRRCGEWFELSHEILAYILRSACEVIPSRASDVASNPAKLKCLLESLRNIDQRWTESDVIDMLEALSLEAELIRNSQHACISIPASCGGTIQHN